MKKITISCFTIFLMLLTIAASAQKAKLKRANQEFEIQNYNTAILLYLEVLDKADISEAKIKLAESYRKIDNTGEAEYWYGQIVHLPEAKPIWYLHYAKALYENGKCELAKPWLEKYEATLDENARVEKSLFEITDCDEFKIPPRPRNDFYEIRKLPFNSKYDDFSPIFYKGGLLFASEREESKFVIRGGNDWTGNPDLNLFFISIDTTNAEASEFIYNEKLENYSKIFNTKYNDGPIIFNNNATKVFFTRNNLSTQDAEQTIRLKIFSADVDDDKWTNIQGLPFNSDEYSVAHPALSLDGKTLYFSSNMPDGFGGMDLYFSIFENGQWSPPKNLGPKINTEGHEVFPYIHTSGCLYFSSDGHFGLGGLDIYYCDNNDGVWGKVKNMGFPINATTDDFGIIMNDDETFGYFTSNREGGEGRDDIYSFKHDAVEVEILVYDENTNKPVENAEVLNDCSNLSSTTNVDGKIVLQLPLNKCCSFITNKENYDENVVEHCTHDYKNGRKVSVKIPMKQQPKRIVGLVSDTETDKPLKNAIVTLTSDCGETIKLKTDENGRYHFDLEKDCCYSLKAEYQTYFTVSKDKSYCTNDMEKTDTLDFPLFRYLDSLPNDSSKIEVNKPCDGIGRSFVIQHIYYDFGRNSIKNDTILKELIKILSDNPDLIIDLNSNTDVRGSSRYSIDLSSRRAESVAKYLIKNGIDANRLRVKGEKILPNSAENEIPNVEEQHQRNRRTEFRVIGKLDGTNYDCGYKPINSIKLNKDKCTNCPF